MPALRSLGALIDAEELTAFDVEEDMSILARDHPPLQVRVIPSPAMLVTVMPAAVPTTGPRTTTELVESFMSAWSCLVGDPLLSKWIVVVRRPSRLFTEIITLAPLSGNYRTDKKPYPGKVLHSVLKTTVESP
ncbi:hypothetical protein BDZ89DRAFT_407665 [Hymenopellis radicata]|nr:hypothetical protein BDZ89DRAFT_407665 [Hymenopellis radicata]